MHFGTFCKESLGFFPCVCFDKVQVDLKICLDEMEKEGVIEKQHNATDWVSSLPCTPKANGKLP